MRLKLLFHVHCILIIPEVLDEVVARTDRNKAESNLFRISGIFGKVVKVAERRVVLEIAERVQVEFLIDAISQVINETPAAEEKK